MAEPEPKTPPRVAKEITEEPEVHETPKHSNGPSVETASPASTLRAAPIRAHTLGEPALMKVVAEQLAASPRTKRVSKASAASIDAALLPDGPASAPLKGTAVPLHQQQPDPATLLHPSSAASNRPTRRNTTGSLNPLASSKRGRSHKTSTTPTSTAPQTNDPDLDADILHQAEQIRRERKQREEAEANKYQEKGKKSHSRSGSAGGKSDEWKPIVGHVVAEGHVNYILMYNMLTGIRVAVSESLVLRAM